MTRRPLQPLAIRASDIARAHTTLAFAAFLAALALGCALHFKKIVKNGVAGYPLEWFPSVSATIGDWYPERSIFHILIALNSGPRFASVVLQYYVQRSSVSSLPFLVFLTGLVRTLSCGGWVYITSEDDHDAHDVLMIIYIACNVPWMLGGISCTPKECVQQRRKRFFLSMLPMIYFFVRHKVYRIAGAYTYYAMFEWTLIFTDVLYDSVTVLDFMESDIQATFPSSSIRYLSNLLPYTDHYHNGRLGCPEHKKVQYQAVHFQCPEFTHPLLYISQVDQLNEQTATRGHKTARLSEGPQKPATKASSSNSNSSGKGLNASYKTFTTLLQTHRVKVSFLADLYLAFIFWSLYTSLIPSLFYFSVWELGIAGTELALLAILSPGLLGLEVFRDWASSRSGRVTLHILSFLGLVAYKLPKPTQRLALVAFANVFLCMGVATDWSGLYGSTDYQSILLGLGLGLSSLSKHANHSNNPVWPMLDEYSGGFNKTGIFLAALAVWELATRPISHVANEPTKEDTVPNAAESMSSWLPRSLSIGGLIFNLHCFLSDPGTLIAWTWTGYPIQGPVPHLHGALTLVAQSTGLLIPLVVPPSFLSSPVWFSFGAASSFILYSYKNWLGYVGGLGVAAFLMSIIPQTLSGAADKKYVGRTYFSAFLVAILFYFANVWTVAYAFVPGGEYLRERTDLVLFAQIMLLAPAFSWPGLRKNTLYLKLDFPPSLKSQFCSTLAIIAALSGLVSLYRVPSNAPQPFRPGPRILRAGIWTVHFGMDNEGRDSQRAMKTLIQDMELDIVGLLETDLHRPVYGNRDLTRVLVEDIGYYVDLGPGPNQHTWGAVLLSKFPIINSTHHLLPSPHGELAPAITAYLDVWGTEVMVVVAHNGQEEDPLDRELQSRELARIMNSAYPTPVIFLGYVVTKPHAPRPSPYQIIAEDGRVHDIDAFDEDRWCEYIFYRGLYRTSYLRMSRGRVTDTELQIGQFVVPRFGHSVTDESESARYLRVHKETLDERHWFPMVYYGNEQEGGKNGHFYHVFGTPLYYNIPDDAIL
ncbi:hypothetical protein M0805_007238 [Coniferiporia weirii]|nr:hypothetical protein M0805_007238 [Coniferiporia weirii]